MGILEAVKKGFSLSPKLLNVILIFFILNVVMGLVSLPLAKPENVGKPGIAAASLGLSLVFFLIFIFLQGGALGLVRDIHKTGSFNMSDFAVYGRKYYLRILGLLLVYVLIALAIVVVLALIGSGIMAIGDNIFTRSVVGAIVGVVAVIAIVLLLLPIYSVVADENGVIKALGKGIRLARENFWKVLGLFLTLVVISVLISLAIGFIIGLITVPLPFTVSQIIITIVNGIVQSYIPIVMMLALMGYYLSLAKGAESPQQDPTGPTA